MTTDSRSTISNMDTIIDHCANLTRLENQRYLERLDKLRRAAVAQASAQH